jgi:HEPN domain-containing protein
VKKEEVERLLKRSRSFKDAADFHFSRGDYDLTVFSLEQSLHLFFKAKLIENGVDFPKTHSLRRLFLILGQVIDHSVDFSEFEKSRSLEFSSLEDAYVTSRYFPREFTKGEAERLMKFYLEVVEFVGRFLG